MAYVFQNLQNAMNDRVAARGGQENIEKRIGQEAPTSGGSSNTAQSGGAPKAASEFTKSRNQQQAAYQLMDRNKGQQLGTVQRITNPMQKEATQKAQTVQDEANKYVENANQQIANTTAGIGAVDVGQARTDAGYQSLANALATKGPEIGEFKTSITPEMSGENQVRRGEFGKLLQATSPKRYSQGMGTLDQALMQRSGGNRQALKALDQAKAQTQEAVAKAKPVAEQMQAKSAREMQIAKDQLRERAAQALAEFNRSYQERNKAQEQQYYQRANQFRNELVGNKINELESAGYVVTPQVRQFIESQITPNFAMTQTQAWQNENLGLDAAEAARMNDIAALLGQKGGYVGRDANWGANAAFDPAQFNVGPELSFERLRTGLMRKGEQPSGGVAPPSIVSGTTGNVGRPEAPTQEGFVEKVTGALGDMAPKVTVSNPLKKRRL